ncbi:unnamed protein product [Pedinophyceae sp. YPF-701]|nr:unnamed protein product [Pedinophyceae sp. YPF-701]
MASLLPLAGPLGRRAAAPAARGSVVCRVDKQARKMREAELKTVRKLAKMQQEAVMAERERLDAERERWAVREAELRGELRELQAELTMLARRRVADEAVGASDVGLSATLEPEMVARLEAELSDLQRHATGHRWSATCKHPSRPKKHRCKDCPKIKTEIDARVASIKRTLAAATPAATTTAAPAPFDATAPASDVNSEIAAAMHGVDPAGPSPAPPRRDPLSLAEDELDMLNTLGLGPLFGGPPRAAQPAAFGGAAEVAAEAAGGGVALATETAEEARARGPPEGLGEGSEDLYWIAELHRCLVENGFYPSDEEIECVFFGESTREAVLYFQASIGLDETGVVGAQEWEALRKE